MKGQAIPYLVFWRAGHIWHRGLAIHRDRSLQPGILVRIHLNLGRYHVYSMLHIAISQTQLYLALQNEQQGNSMLLQRQSVEGNRENVNRAPYPIWF
jgi:hypothetical protein